jgi:transcriptional regulator with XRE-family HTH domain
MNQKTYLRAERIKRGWTQEYVGRMIGVSKVTIHSIETGKRRASYNVLLELLSLFNVDPKNIIRLFTPVESTD